MFLLFRRCLGESLARMEMFLFFANIFSKGGKDSKGMSYFFKLLDLIVTRNALICMLRLLPQFNDTNASMDLEQN